MKKIGDTRIIVVECKLCRQSYTLNMTVVSIMDLSKRNIYFKEPIVISDLYYEDGSVVTSEERICKKCFDLNQSGLGPLAQGEEKTPAIVNDKKLEE